MQNDIQFGVHFDMPNEVYHALPGASATLLKKLHNSTPAHLRAYLDTKQKETPALIKGTMVHSLVLEPEKELPKIAVQPEEYAPGKKWTYAASVCKEWRSEKEAAGFSILSRDEYNDVYGMARSICKHPVAGRYFSEGKSEVSVVMLDTTNNIPVRCRFDWLPSGPLIVDLKTTRDASEYGFTKLAYDLGYHIQAALYMDCWNAVAGADERREDWKFVAVESTAPYAINVFHATPEFIARGREDYMAALALFAQCTHSGKWPAYSEAEKQLNLPRYAQ
jgi:hypothetical protein